jgi:hypothetical protein
MLVAAHVLGTFVSILSLEESRSDCESFLVGQNLNRTLDPSGLYAEQPQIRLDKKTCRTVDRLIRSIFLPPMCPNKST